MLFSGVFIAISAFTVLNDNRRFAVLVLRRKYKVEINEGKTIKPTVKLRVLLYAVADTYVYPCTYAYT